MKTFSFNYEGKDYIVPQHFIIIDCIDYYKECKSWELKFHRICSDDYILFDVIKNHSSDGHFPKFKNFIGFNKSTLANNLISLLDKEKFDKLKAFL